ncbi:hypothetical protein EKG38_24120 [Shewanella canadensis]|uniref:Glycosyltransferase family 1 protein n=1 Tax=Shewanella canadensis TaxID=271096 RepID=A0A3S0KR68_9GAMM|nr:hypothetical protein [Shewanella canadensis]RTR35962.1 hypothetical protein EKG38_24120 [Shewanella canadensis]
MKNKIVISYFCLPFDGVDEGQAIYDKNFVVSLKNIGYEVNVYPVHVKRSLGSLFPVWSRTPIGFSNDYIIKAKDTFVIVSHESLSSLCDYLKPNLFIVHNLFCSFEFKSKPHIEFLYRFASESIFRRAFDLSEHVLLLSHREKRIAEEKYNRKFICEPPGVYISNSQKMKSLSTKHFRRCGSSLWLPKRASLIPNSVILNNFINNGVSDVNCSVNKNTHRCFGLIEDRFLSGFKLKFIQMYYDGDLILSQSSLSDELAGLGLDKSGYLYVEDFSDLNVDSLNSIPELLLGDEDLRSRRKHLSEVYSWEAIVKRVFLKVFN